MAARKTPTLRALGALVSVVAGTALLLTGCGSSKSTSSGGSGCVTVTGGQVTLTAKTTAFSTSCLRMAPGDLTVTFENEDTGVAHNFHLKDATPKDPDKNATVLKTGPDTQSVSYVDLKPGNYPYVCDIHPMMKGTLTVEEPTAGS